MQRTATPGVFKLPTGEAERERFRAMDRRVTILESLLSTVEDLTARVAALEEKPTRKSKAQQPET